MSLDPSLLTVSLLHVSGSRRGNEEKHELGRITLGRGRGNECAFDAERERSVSHRHCEVRLEEGIPVLYDIGSLNGTYLNGRRVRRAPLSDGDEIGLGREGPRLRFMLHSGKTPGVILPGSLQPEDFPIQIAGTSTEARPSGLEAQMRIDSELRRYRRLTRIFAAAFALALLAGAGVFWHLSRPAITSPMSGEGTPPESSSSPKSGTARATGPAWSLVLSHRDADGREIVNREVGCGVLLAKGRFLTAKSAVDQAERDLAVGTAAGGGSLELVVMGPEGALPVSEVVESPTQPDLALLAFGASAEALGEPLSMFEGMARELTARQPGLADRSVSVTAQLHDDGTAVAAGGTARLLRIQGGPALPGTPLFAGTALAAMSLGDASPGLALAAPALHQFVEACASVPPRPLRRAN